jgi:hypothetical protein
MKVSKNSPKNIFRASISYSKALPEIGSVSTALGMTLEEVKHNSLFYTDQATRNEVTSTVVIYENKKQYPDFDWVEVERFSVNEKRGGKRENSGAKPKYAEPTKTTAFRIPISKIEEVKEVVNRMLSGYAENNQ